MKLQCFNGHPPLGVNATKVRRTAIQRVMYALFQRAPTLGGECYLLGGWNYPSGEAIGFQRAPTLGGECYFPCPYNTRIGGKHAVSMGTHPWG